MEDHFSFKPRGNRKTGPEAKIQHDVIGKLTLSQWLCIVTHGSIFQQGLPDIYATHHDYGHRWIEIKTPGAFSFTPAQKRLFPLLAAHGDGIWVIMSADEFELRKLMGPQNWYGYMYGLIK